MKKYGEELNEGQLQVSLSDFLVSYNKNIPKEFPRASAELLEKFQAAHAPLFTNGDLWSLERHRKRLIDWLPNNRDAA
ncbi:MAG: hypothetical protein ACYC8S_03485 [Minisyncoccota bacterium]